MIPFLDLGDPVKEKLSSATQHVAAAAKARPAETKWSIIGAAIGCVLGLMIGGVGIAAMGGAKGVPAALILMLIGAFIGNRYGISKDRPVG
jgi:predicted lipid-binding transport protein (Tim44 family)